ncbi:MAG: hypothetical protein US36_C0001G0022 [Candidatus Wolfebacteria bacterium GW2011_GWC1_37_10]|uniref:Uncharacterized protein n=1 Tax=Candidatus Wolfebacteria bacterium GW2011_GWC1_37_10 TaxID=1619010 RepID=A0A0G0FWM7_9BACT|nr:MAG: hypothetical protein US36_C0001G0022 [Candidatus Wolfebacteria bacterium GW2011_GWC1_37_10]
MRRRWMIRAVAHCSEGCSIKGEEHLASPIFLRKTANSKIITIEPYFNQYLCGSLKNRLNCYFKVIRMAPETIKTAPKTDFQPKASPKNKAAKKITKTMLKRSMATTFEARPYLIAIK